MSLVNDTILMTGSDTMHELISLPISLFKFQNIPILQLIPQELTVEFLIYSYVKCIVVQRDKQILDDSRRQIKNILPFDTREIRFFISL
jgi:hypothetical protein